MLPAALLIPLALAGAPRPHPGPPINLQIEVAEDAVVLQFLGEQNLVNAWFGIGGPDPYPHPAPPEIQAALEKGALALLSERTTLTIDGEVRTPTLASARFFESGLDNFEPTVQVDLRYPTLGVPDEMVLDWTLFPPGGAAIPGVVRCGDFQFEWFSLTPTDPGVTWYPAEIDLEPGALVRMAVAPGQRTRGGPLWPAGLALLAGGLAVLALRGVGARIMAAAVGVAAAGLLVAWGSARRGMIRMPTAPEATVLFEGLHRTIYGALSARNEDELYAMLASAVDEDYIDDLYLELRESMIRRNDGGAFCQVTNVEDLGCELDLPEEVRDERDLAFDVVWHWQVDGEVTHYGHTHSRRNVHSARYSVGHDGGGWKILGREVLAHERAEDGEPLENLMRRRADRADRDDADEAEEVDEVDGGGAEDLLAPDAQSPPGEAEAEGDGG